MCADRAEKSSALSKKLLIIFLFGVNFAPDLDRYKNMTQKFNDGRWSRRIDVADFVYNNITPYEGDASFLQGPTERTPPFALSSASASQHFAQSCFVRSVGP